MISMDTRELGAEIRLFDDRPAMLTKCAFDNPTDLYGHTPADMECGTVDQIIEDAMAFVRRNSPARLTLVKNSTRV